MDQRLGPDKETAHHFHLAVFLHSRFPGQVAADLETCRAPTIALASSIAGEPLVPGGGGI